MANVFLAWQNRVDEGTLSGGSWSATLPLANLQNRQVQKVARSANLLLGSTQFTIDLGQPRNTGVIALVVHNIGVTGKVKITASDSAGFSTLYYDSGWVDVWPAGMIPQNLLEWEDDNFWLGTLSASARAGYQSPFIHLLSNPPTMRYWKVEIDDTGNGDGHIQIGRLFMATGWRPTYNYIYGAELGYQDPTGVDTSLSGAEFFDPRSKYRTFRFSLDALGNDEAYGSMLELQRLAGTSGEVLLVPDSDDPASFPARAFVGRLINASPISQNRPTTHQVGYTLKELL